MVFYLKYDYESCYYAISLCSIVDSEGVSGCVEKLKKIRIATYWCLTQYISLKHYIEAISWVWGGKC